ncbi:MAG TPA: aspartate ammonia-lyase [bacterium]|nr:aspartate ammonia-lyase [bacterium]
MPAATKATKAAKRPKFRVSHDTLGEVRVPADMLYGAQTQRAVENFPISGYRLPRRFIRAQGIIKKAAALANRDLGTLTAKLDRPAIDALIAACDEVIAGALDQHFVVDAYQAGAGTSQNMNANEVISNRAQQLLGLKLGDVGKVHPNDHVNMGQSTNDTIHVAMHIAVVEAIVHDLDPAIARLEEVFRTKAQEWDHVLKAGRTHLQDAVPMRLSQEMLGYAANLAIHRRALKDAVKYLLEIGIGGNAIGSGINTPPGFAETACKYIAGETGLPFVLPESLFAFVQNTEAANIAGGVLNALAGCLCKIAGDIRLLASGPRTGLDELGLPAVQPGSSIMPGKVNPVMAEMLTQVTYQVMGCCTTVSYATAAGQLELNVMMPVIAYNLLHSCTILSNATDAFRERCVEGMTVNEARCLQWLLKTPQIATALNPIIGYEAAAKVVKKAVAEDRDILDVVVADGIVSEKDLKEKLDLRKLTGTLTGKSGKAKSSPKRNGKRK